MRIIDSKIITETVKKMCINANCYLNNDIKSALSSSLETEKSNVGKNVLCDLLKNAEIVCEAFDDSEAKAMLAEEVLTKMQGKYLLICYEMHF